MGRGVIIALAVSLAANVFLAGFLAGRVFGVTDGPATMGEPDGRRPPGPRPGGPSGLLGDSLAQSPAAREAVRAAFKERRVEIIRDRREFERQRRALARALMADPFDRPAAEEALAALLAAAAKREREMTGLLLDVLEDLPADERRALIEAAEERRGAHRRRMRREGPPRFDRSVAPGVDAPSRAPPEGRSPNYQPPADDPASNEEPE